MVKLQSKLDNTVIVNSMIFWVCIKVIYRTSWHTKSFESLGPRASSSNPRPLPFDIKTETCSLRGTAQLLPFNERCSSSPCQKQCVTATGWRHLVSLRGTSAVNQNLQSCHFTLISMEDRAREWGHGLGPPVVFPLKCELDDICVLFESLVASGAVLVILCLRQQMNQSITFTVSHCPRHHITILEGPSKVNVAGMTGLFLGCYKWVF